MVNSSLTVTITKKPKLYSDKGIIEVKLDFLTDDADGSVPSEAIVTATQYNQYLAGRECILAVVNPGTPAPTADYDVSITDEHGADVFGGQLNNLSATLSSQAVPLMGSLYGPRICIGIWNFVLANGGNAAAGSVILYFR